MHVYFARQCGKGSGGERTNAKVAEKPKEVVAEKPKEALKANTTGDRLEFWGRRYTSFCS